MRQTRPSRSRRHRGSSSARRRIAVGAVAALLIVAGVTQGIRISPQDPAPHVTDEAATLTALQAATVVATTAPQPKWTTPMRPGQLYLGGNPTAGHVWIARTTGWPAGATFSYQWLADGSPIAGQNSPNYRAPAALINTHKVSVRVVVSVPGYADATAVSAQVRVQPYNPLAGELWPTDNADGGNWDADLIGAYQRATGTRRALLGKVANRPRATWFGTWMSPADSARQVRNYIATVQAGNPQSLVQMSLFAIFGVAGGEGHTAPLTAAQMAAYRAWYVAVAQAIGTSRVAIVMEPDLALLAPPMSGETPYADASRRMALIAWATQLLAKNPHASIYLDSGDSDWQHVSTMAPILKASGIAYARGFALGATHYSSVGDNIAYAAAMKTALAKIGLPDKHAVIDTVDNGKGFTWAQYKARYGSATFDNATPCASVSAPPPCDTLGVPPTWQIVDTRTRLTSTQTTQALSTVDAYLWFGRPWLDNQAWPFDLARTLKVAGSSPYA